MGDQVLVHDVDPGLPLTLVSDASVCGIGTVIQQTIPREEERLIALVLLNTVSSGEKYSHIYEEDLVLV